MFGFKSKQDKALEAIDTASKAAAEQFIHFKEALDNISKAIGVDFAEADFWADTSIIEKRH